MSVVNLMIQLQLLKVDMPAFDGADLLIIPHMTAEREGVMLAMAHIERCVEASGDAEAVCAFQWLGGFIARAKYSEGAKIGKHPTKQRFDA